MSTELIYAFVAVAVVVAYAVGVYTAKCSPANPCPKCAYHANEGRMARLRQADLNHDTEHKGFGWKTGAPDIRDCHDEACSRNRPRGDA